MAKGAARQRPKELADPVAFTAGPYGTGAYGQRPEREVTPDKWIVPAVCEFWLIVWMGGCGLWVVRAHRKSGDQSTRRRA